MNCVLPKSWEQIMLENINRVVATKMYEWDGSTLSTTVAVPITPEPLLLAIDNQSGKTLTLTFAYLLRRDDAQASAQIGQGTDGVVTVTCEDPGPAGEAFSVEVVVPTVEEDPVALSAVLEGKRITVTLAADTEGVIDEENTATLVAAEIDAIKGFSASASGDGSGAFEAAVEAVPFTGGLVDVWASLYGLDDNPVQLSVADKVTRVFALPERFPRFMGGRLVLTAAVAPDDQTTTWVQILEARQP